MEVSYVSMFNSMTVLLSAHAPTHNSLLLVCHTEGVECNSCYVGHSSI